MLPHKYDFLNKAKSFKSFSKSLNSLIVQDKRFYAGLNFEKLVKAYLLNNPKYKLITKNVWLLNEVPLKVKKFLNLPKADEGIDLILETKNRKYWSIQAKYKSNKETSLTTQELSKFHSLSYVHCNHIDHAVVCSTSSKPPKKKELLDNVSYVLSDVWIRLDENSQEEWTQLLPTKNKLKKPKPFTARDYQVKATKIILDKLQNASRGRVLMPCGTGKSYLSFYLTQQTKYKKILINIPSLALLNQTLNNWTRELVLNNIDATYLCVCSDESAGSIESDDFVENAEDLGIKTTTNSEEIKEFLSSKSSGIKIVFCTYQSGRVLSEAAKKINFNFELGIFDEAHKTVGHSSKQMAHLLYEKNIKIKRRLFMTATERVYHGRHQGIISMDDEKIYGKMFYEMSFARAIKDKIISPYKIITLEIYESDIENLIKRNKLLELQKSSKIKKEIFARDTAVAIALRKTIIDYNLNKVLTFHSSIKKAENFSKVNESLPNIYTDFKSIPQFHVSGKTPTRQRAQAMLDFQNSSKGIITNARCLTEGVDMPSIDCVVFCDPKKSRVDIVQATGRALRLSKKTNKKFGYIFVPTIINDQEDFIKEMEKNPYEEIVKILGTLSFHDSRLAEEIRVITEGKVPRGGTKIIENITTKKFENVDADYFSRAISSKVWDKIYKKNYLPFDLAKELVQARKFKTNTDYVEYVRNNPKTLGLPVQPHLTYSNKWDGWIDFLGTEYYSYAKAKKIIENFKFKSSTDFRRYLKSKDRDEKIPSTPATVYGRRSTWKNWGDFLGNGIIATQQRKFLPFKEARNIIRKKKFKRVIEFTNFKNSKKFPTNIPKKPEKTYKNEFVSYPDWIGMSPSLSSKHFKSKILSYNQIKKICRENNIKTTTEYRKFVRKENLLAYSALLFYEEYKKEGAEKFFGIKKKLNYEKAKKLIKKFNFKNYPDYIKFLKKNKKYQDLLPLTPSQYYGKKIFRGFDDYLSKIVKYDFEKSKKFIKALKLKTVDDWNKYKQSKNFPEFLYTDPHRAFGTQGAGKNKNKYKGIYDYLGIKKNKIIYQEDLIPKEKVLIVNKKTKKIIKKVIKKIHKTRVSSQTLKKEKIEYLNYDEAKKFLAKFKFKNRNEWLDFKTTKKMPINIPKDPAKFYLDKGWRGMSDFLSNSNKRDLRYESFLTYEEAKKYLKKYKIKNFTDWRKFMKSSKFPVNLIPKKPERYYKNEWKNLGDFLGTGTIASHLIRFVSFVEAKKYAQSFKFKDEKAWRAHCMEGKKPANIPAQPNMQYKGKGWNGYLDFLGIKKALPKARN